MGFSVSVFGGSQPLPGDVAYTEAHRLGRLLGEKGFAVLTGGYMGTMEAVSRGASETGGKVVGVTCDEIEVFRPVGPNEWVQEEIRCKTLRERLGRLMDEADAVIALPGGVGTFTEIMLTWNHLLTGAIDPIPLILVGAGWKETISTFYRTQGAYIPDSHRRWISFGGNVDEAVKILCEAME